MKKIFTFVTYISVILIIIDITVGYCSSYFIKNYQLTGRYKPLDRLIKKVDSDIILIGNSAILNSLDPKVLEEGLSMTCYNGGIIGQGIDFSETMIDCILQRHTPKMIILGLRPEEIGGSIGDGIYDVLKPYYKMGYKSIDNHFNKTSRLERLLLQSNLIRYNTIWVRVLLYMIFDNTKYQDNGFMPMDIPTHIPTLKKIIGYEQPVKEKLKCIERIITKCDKSDICLIICFPPTLMVFDDNPLPCVKAVKDLCSRHHVSCFIDYNNKNFIRHPEVFYDNGHVNKVGANIYSHIINDSLKIVKLQNK